ncbi:hypothetical protein FG386_000935 [Cryptosporidium ryanae]|uniref:uncharacterized protein n=1 Tax=Cryptosporidium ryanae TaxID=515981 RepID=UPI00351A5810|nr:hypothetical protein FG386_000935 [Cryptosporidium ryanae]
MRKSFATLIDNLGNTIGIGGTPMRSVDSSANESNRLQNENLREDFGVRNNMIFTSPSRPLGLPPPLPYMKEKNNVDNAYNGNMEDHSLKNSSSIENTRVLTPFNISKGVIRPQSNNNLNTPITKSVVRIKSMIQTPKKMESNLSFNGGANTIGRGNFQSTSIFTPQSCLNKGFDSSSYVEKTPIRYEENNSDNLNVVISSKASANLNSVYVENSPVICSNTLNNDNNIQTMENMEILRKRLNEKNQEIHFLRRTVKDLENRILSFEGKEKTMLENEINTKKRLDELLVEKRDYIEKIRFIQDELIKSKEDNTNIVKENSCLSSENELKNYEIKKLNDEIINLEIKYKNNFTVKYLNPIKNILYEFITEIKDKFGGKTLINVDFSSNMEIDLVIKTLHEYINHLKNSISYKLNEDKVIIEKLHDEINKINKNNQELKIKIEEQKLHLNNSKVNNYENVNVCEESPDHNEDVFKDKSGERKSIVNFGLKNFAKSLINYTYSIKNNKDSDSVENFTDESESLKTRKSKLKKSLNSKDIKKVRKVIKKTDSIDKSNNKAVKNENDNEVSIVKRTTRTKKQSNVPESENNVKNKLNNSSSKAKLKAKQVEKKVVKKKDIDQGKNLIKKGSVNKTIVSKSSKPQPSVKKSTKTGGSSKS